MKRMSMTAYLLLHTNPGPLQLPEQQGKDARHRNRDHGESVRRKLLEVIREGGRMTTCDIRRVTGIPYPHQHLKKLQEQGQVIETKVRSGTVRNNYYELNHGQHQ